MAVVDVLVTDGTPVATKWELPSEYDGLRSPIPIGLVTYIGKDDVAAKTNVNQTNYVLTLNMPDGFAYLPKNISLRYTSDDLVVDFNDNGSGSYSGAGIVQGPSTPNFNILSPGQFIVGAATRARKIWNVTPITPKLLLLGGGAISFGLVDMSADASVAGDMTYYIQFYVFHVDQVDKWEVNTPIPTISHTAF